MVRMNNINLEALMLTGLTALMTITFTSFLSILGSILAIIYWFSLIKNKIINPYYKGSWKKYITSLITKKQKK